MSASDRTLNKLLSGVYRRSFTDTLMHAATFTAVWIENTPVHLRVVTTYTHVNLPTAAVITLMNDDGYRL